MEFGLSILILIVAMILAFSAKWAVGYFGLSSFSQLIYHIKVPLDGTNIDVLYDWIKMCLLPSIISTGLTMSILFFFFKAYMIIIALVIFIILIAYAAIIVGLPYYVKTQIQKTVLYEEYYIEPNDIKIVFPSEKKNLIHIYLESMEIAHMDKAIGGNSEINLIPELTELAKDNINFSNTEKVGGALPVISTGWTTAGLVASTSGVPINMSINAKKYNKNTEFMPGVVSLGDILQKEGYNQEFLCGSNANFGGRSYYYQKHGNFKVYDLFTAREEGDIPEKYKKFWGFEDRKLFKIAQKEILKLSNKDKPFNFTMLTVDTHHPNGYRCELCGDDHKKDMANILSCQSKQLNGFINWLKQQAFYKDTLIVIQGDHLSMAAEFMNSTYEKTYDRTIYNTFINSSTVSENIKNRKFTTLDLYPTILSSLGAEIEGDRLGLGTNLFSKRPTIVEEMGMRDFNKELSKRSNYYNKHIL